MRNSVFGLDVLDDTLVVLETTGKKLECLTVVHQQPYRALHGLQPASGRAVVGAR